MTKQDKIGILFPGQMGVFVASSLKNSGYDVYWPSADRSSQTRERAAEQGLYEFDTLAELCEASSVILSVCPPHLAEDVANQVLRSSFKGLYLDANAISPQRVKQIGRKMDSAGITFVDGGIIGLPFSTPGDTWLYLSGTNARTIAAFFTSGSLETAVIGDEIGKASALKMCFAANTKGTTALLCAILATAEQLGVRKELQHHWSRNGSSFADDVVQRIRNNAFKAWRFTGEMKEISATFSAAGIPGEFHAAASEIYRRLSNFKDTPSPPVADMLAALLASDKKPTI